VVKDGRILLVVINSKYFLQNDSIENLTLLVKWSKLVISFYHSKLLNMKPIRFLAGILLLITGILHVVLYIKTPNDPGSIGLLIFGIIYAIIGILLFNRKIYPLYLGLIIPLIGMTLSIIKFGIPDLISLLALFKLIGITVIICCGYLLLNLKKM